MSILCLTPRRTQLCFALRIQLFHPIQASRLLFGGDKSSNRVGQPCTARSTVGRPTGSANRARPGTQSAGQLGRPTVHGQEHGQPANRVGQRVHGQEHGRPSNRVGEPCTARNTVSRPTGPANRARPGTHGQPANRVGQPCTARNTVSWAHGQHGQP